MTERLRLRVAGRVVGSVWQARGTAVRMNVRVGALARDWKLLLCVDGPTRVVR